MITAEELRSELDYNRDTGEFIRKVSVQGQRAGSFAGCVSKSIGYVTIGVRKKRYLAHRLAWLFCYGRFPNCQIDHINGIRSDNRILNLREASSAQNRQNQTEFKRNNSSGYLGVYLDKNTCLFVAKIKVDKKQMYIGSYHTAEDAHEAYRHEKARLHPFGTLSPTTEYPPEKVVAKTKTGFRGVQPTKSGRYIAFVTLHGANRSVGVFDFASDAYLAHANANKEILETGVDEWVKRHDEENLVKEKSKRKNASGLAGVEVVKSTGKYTARIRKDGIRLYLGQFDTAELASSAYMTAKKELYGKIEAS